MLTLSVFDKDLNEASVQDFLVWVPKDKDHDMGGVVDGLLCGCACLCFDLSEKGVEKEEKKASRKMMIVQFDVFLPSFFPI